MNRLFPLVFLRLPGVPVGIRRSESLELDGRADELDGARTSLPSIGESARTSLPYIGETGNAPFWRFQGGSGIPGTWAGQPRQLETIQDPILASLDSEWKSGAFH